MIFSHATGMWTDLWLLSTWLEVRLCTVSTWCVLSLYTDKINVYLTRWKPIEDLELFPDEDISLSPAPRPCWNYTEIICGLLVWRRPVAYPATYLHQCLNPRIVSPLFQSMIYALGILLLVGGLLCLGETKYVIWSRLTTQNQAHSL